VAEHGVDEGQVEPCGVGRCEARGQQQAAGPPEEIAATRVLGTFVEGRRVYTAG
jgi:predicted amidohydrolase YtcJ